MHLNATIFMMVLLVFLEAEALIPGIFKHFLAPLILVGEN